MKKELEQKVMKEEIYFRIGTEYWKFIYVRDTIISKGCFQLIEWNASTIIFDYNKEYLNRVRKFDKSENIDRMPRLDYVFYYVDFKKGKDYLSNPKRPKTVYYLIDEKKFFDHVGLDRESILGESEMN